MPDIDWTITPKDRIPLAIAELDGMARRAAVEKSRYEDATCTGFYICLVFQSDAQAAAFVAAAAWAGAEDAEDPCYVDGVVIAQRMGIALPPTPPERKCAARSRWGALATGDDHG